MWFGIIHVDTHGSHFGRHWIDISVLPTIRIRNKLNFFPFLNLADKLATWTLTDDV